MGLTSRICCSLSSTNPPTTTTCVRQVSGWSSTFARCVVVFPSLSLPFSQRQGPGPWMSRGVHLVTTNLAAVSTWPSGLPEALSSSVLVTTSKALVTRSDALVPSSFLLLVVRPLLLVVRPGAPSSFLFGVVFLPSSVVVRSSAGFWHILSLVLRLGALCPCVGTESPRIADATGGQYLWLHPWRRKT